jgi:serine/threonine-protein kinase
MERTPAGGWRIRASIVHSASEPALLARHGAGFEVRWPVMAISWHEAAAWCEWKSRTTGREWRLPTELEREKAARGVDGRAFPWGELDDPTLAKCSQSRQEPSQPEPVGSFPTATSVYGMVDAAGGVWDWTDSWSDSRAIARVVRGGSWTNGVTFLRCAMRHAREPGFRGTASGFRPARSLQ